jgi:hypothetical protein
MRALGAAHAVAHGRVLRAAVNSPGNQVSRSASWRAPDHDEMRVARHGTSPDSRGAGARQTKKSSEREGHNRRRAPSLVENPMASRRTVLKALGIGAATLLVPRPSRADTFGVFPRRQALGLPEGRAAKNILEIYLYGGLSPWESFYFVPGRGKRDNRFFHAFDAEGENKRALEACGIEDVVSQRFAKDAAGIDVRLGPFARQLFARPDLIDRLRVVVQRHELLPHEAAVPYGICGKFVGSPSLSSLAAHVQQASQGRDAREVPYSYVMMTAGAIPSDNTDAFVATGTHPGTARPLRLNIDDASRLETLLTRPGVGGDKRKAYDAYLAARVESYGARLRHAGRGEMLRSKAARDLSASAGALARVDSVAKMLPGELLSAPTTNLCAATDLANYPLASLKLATHLLKHPRTPARYVCVLDSGLVGASGGGGYDTHAGGEQLTQLTNLENLLGAIASLTNKPGEKSPDKLDLDETMIILNTEFGRTPGLQMGPGSGRNHHSQGYVTVFLGGPVEGRSIAGAIDLQGDATEFVTPTENRIAALLAMGVYPFSADAFSLSDVSGARNEPEAVRRALSRVLGTKS